MIECSISEESSVLDNLDSFPKDLVYGNGNCTNDLDSRNYSVQSVVCEEVIVPEESVSTLSSVTTGSEFEILHAGDAYSSVTELRQRSSVVNGGGGGGEEAVSRIEECREEDSSSKELGSSFEKQRAELNGNVVRKLEKEESLDWKRLMAEDPNRELIITSLLNCILIIVL